MQIDDGSRVDSTPAPTGAWLVSQSGDLEMPRGSDGQWRHWTGNGTFRIEPKRLAGSWFYELWCNDRSLGTYAFVDTAAGSITRGDYDEALGFRSSELGVPSDADAWNGFR
jgi:hypothetical protein